MHMSGRSYDYPQSRSGANHEADIAGQSARSALFCWQDPPVPIITVDGNSRFTYTVLFPPFLYEYGSSFLGFREKRIIAFSGSVLHVRWHGDEEIDNVCGSLATVLQGLRGPHSQEYNTCLVRTGPSNHTPGMAKLKTQFRPV
jgi:hypothetical protein